MLLPASTPVKFVNSYSRFVTHSALSMSMPLLEVLCGSELAEQLVAGYGVVGFLPLRGPSFAAAISSKQFVTW